MFNECSGCLFSVTILYDKVLWKDIYLNTFGWLYVFLHGWKYMNVRIKNECFITTKEDSSIDMGYIRQSLEHFVAL